MLVDQSIGNRSLGWALHEGADTEEDANHWEKGDHSGARFDYAPCMDTYTNRLSRHLEKTWSLSTLPVYTSPQSSFLTLLHYRTCHGRSWFSSTYVHISAGASTTPPIKFQNVKEICRVVVLESLFNSTYLAN